MIIDLSTIGIKDAIDVQKFRRVSIQTNPALGDATTAVVEIKRAFSLDFRTPSTSFSTAQTIVLDGSEILEIDVTDTAFLHVVVTTAQADRSVDIEHTRSGVMDGFAFVNRVDVSVAGSCAKIPHNESRKAMVLASPVSVNSSTLEVKRSLDPYYQSVAFSPTAALTIDGATITEIDTTNSRVLDVVVGTAQSGQIVDLYFYIRKETVDDHVVATAGTSFPLSPTGGQAFTRTDLENETFHYDATRAKWLGELQVMQGSYAGALAAGSTTAVRIGGLVPSSARGYLFPNDMTIVGADIFTALAFTGTLQWKEGGSTLHTLLSVSAARGLADYTLNLDFDGDAVDPQKWAEISTDAGSANAINNAVVRVYARRHAT